MLVLKHNTLTSKELFKIESKYLNLNRKRTIDVLNLDVLECEIVELYSHLLWIFKRLEVLDTLKLTVSELLDFLIDVKNVYNDTPYHSFYHATDVVIVLYYILDNLEAKKYFTNLEISALCLAAICHDAGHDGYNNDYHRKMKTDIAIEFNSKSILESLSIKVGLRLLKKHEISILLTHNSMFQNLILSTDMENHSNLLNELNKIRLDHNQKEYHKSLLLACIFLHAADISNAVRSWSLSKKWSDLVLKEFFNQGDSERRLGLVISIGMNRDKDSQKIISLRFIETIAQPYFESLTHILPNSELFVNTLIENKEIWLKLEEEDSKLEDFKFKIKRQFKTKIKLTL